MVDRPETFRENFYFIEVNPLLRLLTLPDVEKVRLQLQEILKTHTLPEIVLWEIPNWGISLGQLMHVIDTSLWEISQNNGTEILFGHVFIREWLFNPSFLDQKISVHRDLFNIARAQIALDRSRNKIVQSTHLTSD